MTKLFLLAAMTCMTNIMLAQPGWQVSKMKTSDAPAATETEEVGNIYLGYAKPNDIIYPYDGLSVERDSKVGVAIKLLRKQFQSYIGSKLSSLMLGWDTDQEIGNAEAFVRSSLTGDNLASTKGELKMGWNTIAFDTPFIIPDVDTLVLGYYVNLKKDVISIPKVYPLNQPFSCYLWMEGDTTSDGKEMWYNAMDFGTMTIIGVVEDTEGKFKNLVNLANPIYDNIVYLDSVCTLQTRICNEGSNSIKSIEMTTRLGDKSWKLELPLPQAIAPSHEGRIALPYCALGSGMHEYFISKVNNVEVKDLKVYDLNILAVPKAVAEKYPYRHLVEFWTSENNYMHITFFENYTLPYLSKFPDHYVFVNQHTDDQFMTGEQDDVAQMMLDFVDNDSLQVIIPSMSFNRSRYAMNRSATNDGPLHATFYPEYGEIFFNELMKMPTFASVDVSAQWDGNEKVKIVASGEIEKGILLAKEPLYLTVYLMEYDVISNNQLFWDDDQKAAYDGVYSHYNVIRQIVTPVYGKKLAQADGVFSENFEVDVDETWNKGKLGVIAFLNRGIDNDKFNRQVLNSVETKLPVPVGLKSVMNDETLEAPMAIYNMAGVRVDQFNGRGVYLVKYMKNGQPVVQKVMVK